MKRHWVKLRVSYLSDPKRARLPDNLKARYFELMLIAAQYDQGGALPDAGEISWHLRKPEKQIEDELSALMAFGLLDFDGTQYSVKDFEAEQSADTPAERQKAHRASANMSRNSNENSHNMSQNGYTEREIDKELEKEREIDKEAVVLSNSLVAFETNIGPLTPIIADNIDEADKEYTPAWVVDAIGEAAKAGKRNWSYIAGILRNWKTEGRDKRAASSGNGHDPHRVRAERK